jgi:prevent-host-death family protein
MIVHFLQKCDKVRLYSFWRSEAILMSNKLTASEARQNFSDILNRAAFGRERVIIHRGKKAVAAIIPIEDYNFLEQLEDRIDVREARKRLNEPTIPWSKVKKQLGL